MGLDSLKGHRKLATCNNIQSKPKYVIVVPCLFEVGANSEDFVDKVLDGKDVVFSECLLDHLVVGEGYSLFVDLSVTALVDQLADSLEVGLAGECSVSAYACGFRED